MNVFYESQHQLSVFDLHPPLQFAELCCFGSENLPGKANLVLSSREASQGGALAKRHGSGTRQGKLIGVSFLGYVFFSSKKGNLRLKRETNGMVLLNQRQNIYKLQVWVPLTPSTSSGRTGIYSGGRRSFTSFRMTKLDSGYHHAGMTVC